jgi:hypothetical protein
MMRTFGPSLIALVAGAIWATAFTNLIRVDAADSAPLLTPVADAACQGGTMIARLPEIREASGLAASRQHEGVLWTHNDSGKPMVYALGTDGSMRGRVQVVGAQVDDWEDIAVGPCPQGSCLYIADIGDNKASRARIAIYRVPEPAPSATTTQPADVFYATYPDHAQDAETLFIGPNGTLYIVSKGEGSPITIYRFPDRLAAGSAVGLERVATLANKVGRDLRVTDGDITWDGKWIGLRTIAAVDFYRASDLLRGAPAPPIALNLSGLQEPQGEGLAFARDGTVYLAGESGDGTRGGTLARVSCKLSP